MSFVPVGFAEMTVVLRIDGDNEEMNVVFGIETDLATIPASTHCDRVFTAWDQTFLEFSPAAVSLVRVDGRFGNDGADIVATSTLTNSFGASQTTTFLPQNNALLVRKVSGLGGRQNRGRMYIPYVVAEGNVSNVGTLDTTFRGDIQTLADSFLASLADTDPGPAIPMVILHTSEVLAPTPVAQLSVANRIATQRRRLRR